MVWKTHLNRWVEDVSFKLFEDIRRKKKISDQALSGAVFSKLRQNVRDTLQKSSHLDRQSGGLLKSLFYCLLSTGESLQTNMFSKSVASHNIDMTVSPVDNRESDRQLEPHKLHANERAQALLYCR